MTKLDAMGQSLSTVESTGWSRFMNTRVHASLHLEA